MSPCPAPDACRTPEARWWPWPACGAALLLGLLLTTASAAPVVEDRLARFESVGDLDSIPDGVVTALVQDDLGFLWIGTTQGLIRHDGYRFRREVHQADRPGALGGNLVRSLLVDRQQRLWVGTDADGVSIRDPDTGRFEVLREGAPAGFPPGPVMAMVEDPVEGVWIGARGGGVARVDARGRVLEAWRQGDPAQPPPRSDQVHTLLIDSDGALWIGTRDGLRRLVRSAGSSARPQRVSSSPREAGSLAGEAIYALMQATDGSLWIGTQSGRLLRRDAASGQLLELGSVPGTAPGVPDTVSALLQLDAQEVWVGRARGIEVRAVADGRLLRIIRHDPRRLDGLAGNEIRVLLRDRSGLLWVGAFGGGVQWHDPRPRWVEVLRGEAGHEGVFEQPDLAAIYQRRDGQIWIGTRGRGVAILSPELELIDGIPVIGEAGRSVAWVTAILESSDGRLWLGSRDGLWRRDPGQTGFERYGQQQGLDNLAVRRLFEDGRGRLWVGTADGAFVYAGAGLQRVQPVGGQPLVGEINAFAEEPDGRIWLGGRAGLYTSEPGGKPLRPVAAADGRPLSSVVGLLLDSRGRLWVDTVRGLYLRAQPGSGLVSVSAPLGLEGDFGANLLEDDQGRIWTHRHVLDPESMQLYSLARSDGVDFGTGWFRAYLRTREGLLLFGGSRGLLVIRPERFRPWDYLPEPRLTEARAGNRTIEAIERRRRIELHAHERSLSLEFAALDFRDPRRLRYAYRLAGLEQDWTEVGADERFAAYRNLPAGEFVFELRASGRSGRWTEQPLRVPVQVRPRWWETRPARALGLIAALLLLVLAVRLRTGALRAQATRLERKVRERTGELEQARQRAETALAELRAAQSRLVESEKMAALGGLVAGVAHEINTPVGIAVTAASHLHDITGEIERRLAEGRLSRAELQRWQTKVREGCSLVLSSLERASRLIGSFKRVAVDQSSEAARNFELADFLDEVAVALGPQYRRAGHELVIDCPRPLAVHTYPGALFQVFTNLVANAQQHAFVPGRAGRMWIRVRPEGEQVEIEFGDDGRGIDAATLPRVFEPFFTTRRDQGGSGLGLHLVYNLVTHLLEGEIAIHSEPGRGTRFLLRIPLQIAGRKPPNACEDGALGRAAARGATEPD